MASGIKIIVIDAVSKCHILICESISSQKHPFHHLSKHPGSLIFYFFY